MRPCSGGTGAPGGGVEGAATPENTVMLAKRSAATVYTEWRESWATPSASPPLAPLGNQPRYGEFAGMPFRYWPSSAASLGLVGASHTVIAWLAAAESRSTLDGGPAPRCSI